MTLELILDVFRFLLKIFGVSLAQQEIYLNNVRARFRDKSATQQPNSDEENNLQQMNAKLDAEKNADKNG